MSTHPPPTQPTSSDPQFYAQITSLWWGLGELPKKNIYLHSLNPVAVVSDLSSQKLATAISHVTVFDAIGQHVKQLLDGWRLVFAKTGTNS